MGSNNASLSGSAAPPRPVVAPSHALPALSTVGRLAAELSHDLNNQLSVILNYSFILQRALSQVPGARAHMDELSRAAWRATRMIEGLRRMGGVREHEPREIELNRLLVDMAPLLAQLGHGCELRLSLATPSPCVEAPLAQLEHVICAVVQHVAGQARDGGVLVVATGHAPGGVPELCVRLERSSAVYVTRRTSNAPLRSLGVPRELIGHGQLRRAFRRSRARSIRRPGCVQLRFDR